MPWVTVGMVHNENYCNNTMVFSDTENISWDMWGIVHVSHCQTDNTMRALMIYGRYS